MYKHYNIQWYFFVILINILPGKRKILLSSSSKFSQSNSLSTWNFDLHQSVEGLQVFIIVSEGLKKY